VAAVLALVTTLSWASVNLPTEAEGEAAEEAAVDEVQAEVAALPSGRWL
jgi:hypothetical protein